MDKTWINVFVYLKGIWIVYKEITTCCESMIHLYSNPINKYNLKSNTLMYCIWCKIGSEGAQIQRGIHPHSFIKIDT